MAAVAMSDSGTADAHVPTTVSVVISIITTADSTAAGDTDVRWNGMVSGLESLERQTRRPDQVVIVIDHDDELLERAADEISERVAAGDFGFPVDVVANTRQRGLGGARNTGVSWSNGDVIAFLHDAVVGDVYWVATMMEDYADPSVAGVGGGATPDWPGGPAPKWFPSEFGWVIGCSHTGLPNDAKAVRDLIGCNMSFRRDVFDEVGGFTDNETEFCVRIRNRFDAARLVFDPDLDVQRRVSADSSAFPYFRMQCWSEGVAQAAVARRAGVRRSAASERAATITMAPQGLLRGIADGCRGRVSGFQRAGAIVVGLLWTGAGYTHGRLRRPSSA